MAQSKRIQTQIPATLPKLKYEYNELEPVLSKQILEFHHGKHHQTYVNNLNAIAQQIADAQAKGDVHQIAQLQAGLRFNLGGHVNHAIYWENLAPIANGGGVLPAADSPLTLAINQKWGSIDNFIAEFNKRTAAIQVYQL